jgi:hypothetical protein
MRRREFITLVGGAAAAWPLTAHAQQAGNMYRVGVLSAGLDVITPQRQAFEQGLREEGFVERRNLIFEHRFAKGDLERLPAMAAERLLDALVRDCKPALLHRGRDGAQGSCPPSASGALRAAPCARFRAAQPIRRQRSDPRARPVDGISRRAR